MPDLDEISIERTDYGAECGADAGHTELAVRHAIWLDDLAEGVAGHTPQAVRSAANWAAGVLARLALAAEPLVTAERRTHTCSYWDEQTGELAHACHVSNYDVGPDVKGTAVVCVSVRTANVPAWIDRLARWLQQIEDRG